MNYYNYFHLRREVEYPTGSFPFIRPRPPPPVTLPSGSSPPLTPPVLRCFYLRRGKTVAGCTCARAVHGGAFVRMRVFVRRACVCEWVSGQHWLSHLPIRFYFNIFPVLGLLLSSQQFDRLVFIIKFNDRARAIHQCMPRIRLFRFRLCVFVCVCVWGGAGVTRLHSLQVRMCGNVMCLYPCTPANTHVHVSTLPSREHFPTGANFNTRSHCMHRRLTLVSFIWPAASVSGWVYIATGCVGVCGWVFCVSVGVGGCVLENHYPINGF